MKHYNFDETLERHNTDCVKYDMMSQLYGREDLIPMWVADMDFRSPDFVMDAIKQRCNHDVLGYGIPPEDYNKAIINWLAKHYDISANRDELHFIPGIVAGIAYVLLCFTNPGDKVIVTTPVYPPFLNLPKESGRELVCSPLKKTDGRFSIDFDDFEQKSKGCKLFILSNPHNPAGTVWSKQDLCRLAEICHINNILVVADEIHADLTLPGHRHTSFSTVNEIAKAESITFMAPSKTFNIAGLGSSTCYIANPELRKQFFGWLDHLGVAGGNIFAFTGAQAAFSQGEEWLDQLLHYLKGNVETLKNTLGEKLPDVKVMLPEASYLAWLDFSAYSLSHQELNNLIINKARIALNDGTTFGGIAYEKHFRMNIGCPRRTIIEAVERIATALHSL
ncbi:MAG: PatB family C-S lyase [Bacteroidales bacterium]|nr:PatB family C-S lyase [Bacteroidales bacterium]